jgi:hypothetical protein
MKYKNKTMTGIVVGLLAVLLVSFVGAVGVSSTFSEDSPMEMYAGESRTELLILQNTDVEEDASIEGILLEGGDIASLDRNRYTVPYQEKVSAKLGIDVPADASIGDRYTLRFEFKHVSVVDDEGGEGDGSQAVTFSQGVVRSFDVVVIEKPIDVRIGSVESSNIIVWVIVIIVLVVILWILFGRKKGGGKKGTGKAVVKGKKGKKK